MDADADNGQKTLRFISIREMQDDVGLYLSDDDSPIVV